MLSAPILVFKWFEAVIGRVSEMRVYLLRLASPKNLIALLGGILLSACASSDISDLAGGNVSDVNWAFADETAMETKVASLQTENTQLRREVDELRRRLLKAEDDAAIAQAKAQSAAENAANERLRSAVAAQPKPASDPVITSSIPEIDVPETATPVQEAPRLIQPSFASAQPIFENEAQSGIELNSVLWGVHLDSYSRERFAREGWRSLQRTHPDELGLLEPRTERVKIEGRGVMYRLIGGGFASEITAKALCEELSTKDQYCRVVSFGGRKLSMAEPS